MKKITSIISIIFIIIILTSCSQTSNNIEQHKPVTIKESPNKYTWYMKDYVGKNLASFGYTSMGGFRADTYGEGYIKITIINDNEDYIDINNEEDLKQYVVTKQNIQPNSIIKYTFEKNEQGEETSLINHQTYGEIVLKVKKIGSREKNKNELTEIKSSTDKYTQYIKDYTYRNLTQCGYLSMMGDYRDVYGNTNIKLIIITEDGSYVDVSDTEILKNYIVTSQNIKPNTKLSMEYLKDSNGKEYSNLIDVQNINEIELNVKKIK
ncbi:hypothetical protein [Anaerofustis butyriciformans]|uniref:hypothetical protein n=1 Tax=Anaerofustis butyriciformans TaxID=3108533 RepID=UPI002E30D2A3|nr:hypothetical protein [Anaerofustis sp. HA2171]